MDTRTDTASTPKTESPMIDQPQTKNQGNPWILRVLKNPLFLVVFTWVIMAFLLAFDVSGK